MFESFLLHVKLTLKKCLTEFNILIKGVIKIEGNKVFALILLYVYY